MSNKIKATTEDLRRLVAAEWWDWMPGVLFEPADLSDETRAEFADWPDAIRNRVGPMGLLRPEAWLPVVSDPATAGCLLELYFKINGSTRPELLEGLGSPDGILSFSNYATFGDFMVAVLLEDGW